VTSPREATGADAKFAPSAILVFAGLSLACAIASDGFLTADALTHYLYAKYAFSDPTLFVDVWGRPVVTMLYAVPAALAGRIGVRITALIVAIVCAFSAHGIGRGQGLRRPALALLFTLAQPLVFLNSFAEMTELPFAALAGLAFWAYQSRRWWVAAALAGLLPLTRPEGFELIALAGAGLLANRRFLPLLLLALPLLLWNHAGWELYGRAGPWWRWLGDHWPYSRDSTYPAGNPLQLVLSLPAVVSPFVLPATLIGAWRTLRPPLDRSARDTHTRTCELVTLGIPLSILIIHSLLYGLGKMASFGEPRYLLVAAPFWAVLSARGWEWLADRLQWRHPLRWAAVASILPAAALIIHPVLPLRRPAHWETAERFVNQFRERMVTAGYTKVLTAHPAVIYYLGVSPIDPEHVVEWRRDSILKPPPGTVLVWDPIYSARNASVDRAVTLAEVRAAGWVQVPEFDPLLATPPTEPRGPTPDPADEVATKEPWAVFVHAGNPLMPAEAPPAPRRFPSPP
jgi:hypothetical protein